MLRQRLAILQIRRPRDGGSPHRQPISPSSPHVGARQAHMDRQTRWPGQPAGLLARRLTHQPGASGEACESGHNGTLVPKRSASRTRTSKSNLTEPNIRHRGITSHTNHTRTARPGTFNPPEYRVVTSAKVPWAVTSAKVPAWVWILRILAAHPSRCLPSVRGLGRV